MLQINLGNPSLSFEKYQNSAELFNKAGENLLPGDEILSFPWPLENNSVSSARLFFKLETITDKRALVSVMKELYRVCCDGALVEIRSSTQYYLDHSPAALFNAHEINASTLQFFDADFRTSFAEDARCANFMPKSEDFCFKTLGENLTLTGAATAKLQDGSLKTQEEVTAFLNANPAHVLYRTFFLAVTKDSSHTFALARLEDDTRFTLRVFPENREVFFTRQVKAKGSYKTSQSLAFSRLVMGMTKYHHEFNQGFHIANIGANVGWFSLLSCFFSDLAKVDAFEPNQEAVEMLHHNVALHDMTQRIAVYPIALSDTKSEATLYVDPASAGASSLVEHAPVVAETEMAKAQVQVDTLDNVYMSRASSEWPELIVMEAEGHEQKVLDGAKEMFSRGYRPLIMTEFVPAFLALRGECSYYRNLCENLGYSAYVIENQPNDTVAQLIPVAVEDLAKAYNEMVENKEQTIKLNLLFVPEWMDITTIRPKA